MTVPSAHFDALRAPLRKYRMEQIVNSRFRMCIPRGGDPSLHKTKNFSDSIEYPLRKRKAIACSKYDTSH